MVTVDNNRINITGGNEWLTVEAWGKNALRVRSTKQNAYLSDDFALLSDVERGAPQIHTTENGAIIVNGKLKCLVANDGRLHFFNQKEEPLFSEMPVDPLVLKYPSRELRPNGAADYSLTLRLTADEDEKFFGMGQYQNGYLNQKGLQLELAQRNSQVSIPFFLSSKNYGFLWNNPAVGTVTFAKNETIWREKSAAQLDYWVTAGDTPAEIEESYAGVTGKVPMMPEYAMGFWQCKLRYRTQEELLGVAREFNRRGLPLSVIVVDYFHWTQQGDWKFDPEFWPDVPAMMAELKSLGIELMVSVWPTVSYKSENFKEMLDRNLLISVSRGLRNSMDFGDKTLFYDATNPTARQYVWDKVKKNYFSHGIRTFWLDAIEPEYSEYDFDNYRYFIGAVEQVGNIYPMMCAKAVYDGLTTEGITDPVSLARCGWAGSQRYGALIWSGDIHSSFDSFRKQVRAGLNMAIAGIPWWTTDIGGFIGGDILSPEFHELLVRWFQFGLYCPVMRLHGDRIAQHPDGTIGRSTDNEPWSFGEKVYAIMETCIRRREALKPYIKEQMRQAHEKGTPVMRPLFYDFPADKRCWEIEDQYMFGPDYLVAPVLSPGLEARPVYLPAGQEWKETVTGGIYEGGQEVMAAAPIEEIPVFMKYR